MGDEYSPPTPLYLIIYRDQGMMRWEGACGAFSMHQQRLRSSVHPVLLNLGNVVRDVVDHVHVQVVRSGFEDFCERLMRNTSPQFEGKIKF